MNNYSNLIGSKRFKLSKNENTNIQLDFEQKSKPLTEYDIIDIVNQYEVFSNERNLSSKYRFNGKLNIYTSNVLSPNSTTYVNGKFDDKAWSPMFYGSPVPYAPSNWVMQITYPSNSIHDYIIDAKLTGGTTISSEAYRGLQYESLGYTNENNTNYLTIKGIQTHNLTENEYVYVYSEINNFIGIYQIRNLGINGENLKKNITLDLAVDPNSIPLGSGNFVRMYDVSTDDLIFNNSSDFISATASDISGNTSGSYNIKDTRYVKIKTQLPHNLVINNFVDIRTGLPNKLNGVWRVYNVVSPTDFILRIDIKLQKGSTITPNPTPKYRLLNATPSEYYIRQYEVLTTNNYEVYPCAFSSNIYPDVSDVTLGTANNLWLFHFNQDVDMGNIKSDRNGPISEVYYTIIKRAGNTPYDWSDVTADWDFNSKTSNVSNGLEFISKYNINGIGSIEKLSGRTEYLDSNNILQINSGSKYIGDFIDFNSKEIKERVISEIIHRFATNQNPNGEGYYYKPFKKLDIRVYSNNIETAKSYEEVIDIPENYITYSDGSIAWRDLLTIGYYEEGTNGVNYPFLNGAHYFYLNHNLFIRRQNPVPKVDNLGSDSYITLDSINQEC